jgi:hypothetical protein
MLFMTIAFLFATNIAVPQFDMNRFGDMKGAFPGFANMKGGGGLGPGMQGRQGMQGMQGPGMEVAPGLGVGFGPGIGVRGGMKR